MPADASDEILRATYRALCAHGYAALTMQDIADEADVSKATLHYHYDSKEDLLLAFFEFLRERYLGRVSDPPGGDPGERLASFVDAALTPPDRDDQEAFQTALLEIKAQAPYDEAFREHIEALEARLHEEVRSILAAGIERGVFRSTVDPDETARFVLTVMAGAHTRQVSVGQDFECARRMLRNYVRTHLYAGEGADDTRGRVGE